MRTRDVSGGGTRLDAALTALLEGLIAPQLAQGAGAGDAVSMLVMRETTDLQFSKVSFLTAKALLETARAGGVIQPKGHGFYVPALEQLGALLAGFAGGLCFAGVANYPVNVLFLSDGRPSEQPGKGRGTSEEKTGAIIQRALAAACAQKMPASVHCIGIGLPDQFGPLEALAKSLLVGKFHHSKLSVQALKTTLSSFSSSITESRLSDVGPKRALRKVQSSPVKSKPISQWTQYKCALVLQAPKDLSALRWTVNSYQDCAVCPTSFASGGERNVFKIVFGGNSEGMCSEEDVVGRGQMHVAKENKHIERASTEKERRLADVEFHKKSLVTQARAMKCAEVFTAECQMADVIGVPEVTYTSCVLLMPGVGSPVSNPPGDKVSIGGAGSRPLFVEQFVEGEYKKFNSNHGTVGTSLGLDAIVDQVPQAFSHFTLDSSGGKELVCDIQGVYNEQKRQFTLVDPVIHSRGKGAHGRTDHGSKGIERFLESHCCNDLCRRLHLPNNAKFTGGGSGPGGGSSLTSKPTDQVTVIKTNHLVKRQGQRELDTLVLQRAVKHGAKMPARGGAIKHVHGDNVYITDGTGRKGITGYRDDGRGGGTVGQQRQQASQQERQLAARQQRLDALLARRFPFPDESIM